MPEGSAMPRAMMTRFRCPEETDPSRKCGRRPGVWSGQDHEPHSAASRFVIARIAHAVPRAAASAFAVSGSGPSGIGHSARFVRQWRGRVAQQSRACVAPSRGIAGGCRTADIRAGRKLPQIPKGTISRRASRLLCLGTDCAGGRSGASSATPSIRFAPAPCGRA